MAGLIGLPGYQIPQNALLDTSGINQAIDSNRQNALAQQQIGQRDRQIKLQEQSGAREADAYKRSTAKDEAMQAGGIVQHIQSLPPDQQPGAWAVARMTPGFKDLPPDMHDFTAAAPKILTAAAKYGFQTPQQTAALDATRAQTAGARGSEARAQEMQPFEMLAKQKAIEASKVGRVKEDEDLYVQDPSAPGGVRFVSPPTNGGRPQRTFDKEYAKKAPELYTEAGKTYADSKSTVETLVNMERVAQYSQTGWGAEGILYARKMASQMGLGNPEKIAPTELLRALSQQFVLKEGQKLKPMSNTDVTFVEKGLATIMSDPSSFPVIVPALRREQERVATANLMRMESLRRGRPPDEEAIFNEVDRKLPSVIRQMFQDKSAPPQAGQPAQVMPGQGGAPMQPQPVPQQMPQQAPPAMQGRQFGSPGLAPQQQASAQPQAQPQAGPSDGRPMISPDAVRDLMGSPTPQRIQQFEQIFGAGSARQFLTQR